MNLNEKRGKKGRKKKRGRREAKKRETEETRMADRVVNDGPAKCTWNPAAEKRAALTDPHDHEDGLAERPKILPNILSHIGKTPLVRLNRIPQSAGVKCEVLVKCEYFNAGGSVKVCGELFPFFLSSKSRLLSLFSSYFPGCIAAILLTRFF
jgi:hypothetical protein